MQKPFLYFVTDKYLGEDPILQPRVPEFTSMMEDSRTKRICVAPTIYQCLIAIEASTKLIEEKVNYKRYRVYRAIYDEETVRQPTADEVSDAYSTGELWFIQPTQFHHVGVYDLIKGPRLGDSYYRRYFFTKTDSDPIVDRVCASVVYGDTDAFSYIDQDLSLRDSVLKEAEKALGII